MLTAEHLLYIIADRTFYESIEQYTPSDKDFKVSVASMLGPGWKVQRTGVWYYCFPDGPDFRLPVQGWKIHLSSDVKSGLELLRLIVPILRSNVVSFKFAVDEQILTLLDSKLWHRGGAGKFVTIYPPDEKAFRHLLECLDQVTAGLKGPFILSDRRYGNSTVVHYRYGGFKPINKLSVDGYRIPQIVGPDGTLVDDQRLPYFAPPAWTEDPYPSPEDATADSEASLRNGRYHIEEALTFSNAGGVYLGRDTAAGDRKVVIKEARPWVYVKDSAHYATSLLEKEFQMLTKVRAAGIAPEPIEYFSDWEHHFLVEDFVEGDSIAKRWSLNNVLIRTHPGEGDYRSHRAAYRNVLRKLCSVLEKLHDQQIIFGDLSPNNLIVSADGSYLKIIDFEGACFAGDQKSIRLYTPGFAPRTIEKQLPCFEDDLYALGALMAYLLFPYNMLYFLDETSKERIIPLLVREVGFAPRLADLILGLMNTDPAERPALAAVRSFLAEDFECGTRRGAVRQPVEAVPESDIVPKLLEFVKAHLSCGRRDRVVPGDKEGFATNPLCVAYGAAGVALTLQDIEGTVPGQLRDCLVDTRLEDRLIPPGLYTGMAGISWALWNCGEEERAVEVMNQACAHPLAVTNPSYLCGAAGHGIAALCLHRRSGNDAFLSFAYRVGEYLAATQVRSEGTDNEEAAWDYDGFDHGLGAGCSGIALFLLYLYAATGEERFLKLGDAALAHDLHAALPTNDGGLSWRRKNSNGNVVYPYWRQGTAGVNSAVTRYMAVTGDLKYRAWLDGIFVDLDRKYTLFPGLFYGQAGIGHSLLDSYELLGEDRYLTAARQIAEGLRVHLLPRDGGLAVPGDGLFRFSCDYATGSCGVTSFLHRFEAHGSTPLFPDELLAGKRPAMESSTPALQPL